MVDDPADDAEERFGLFVGGVSADADSWVTRLLPLRSTSGSGADKLEGCACWLKTQVRLIITKC